MTTSRNNPYVLPLEEGGHGPLSVTIVYACPWIPCGALWCPGPLSSTVTESPKSAVQSPASLTALQTKVGTGEADAPTKAPAAGRDRDLKQIKQC